MSNESKARIAALNELNQDLLGEDPANASVTQLRCLIAEIESLRSQLAARVPDGWKLVPIEPTSEMMIAGKEREDMECGNPEAVKHIYADMLSAAPSQQAPQEHGPLCFKHGDEPKHGCAWCDKQPSQQASKPMEYPEISAGFEEHGNNCSYAEFAEGVRFAERFHKIGEKQ
jgi:hypothetical protein